MDKLRYPIATGRQIIQWLEQLAPQRYAMQGDPIGLQLGTLDKPVKRVLTALDVTMDVVEEAVVSGADLIIAHHAIIYRPLATLATNTPAGQLYEKLLQHQIAVYVTHTNLDVAPGGINDRMADMLGLSYGEGQRIALDPIFSEKLYKLVTFIPRSDAERVLEAMWTQGAGQLGPYAECSFRQDGVGTFRPLPDALPFIGEAGGPRESVDEVRVEVLVPHEVRDQVVQALQSTHPYEHVAYDLLELAAPQLSYGLGRVANLTAPDPIPLADFAETVKERLAVPFVRIVGDLSKPIRRVAVLGGSGGKYVSKAKKLGADVIVTGDVDYHAGHDARTLDIAIIDPGHNIEKLMKPLLSDYLNQRFAEHHVATEAIPSQVNTEVFVIR